MYALEGSLGVAGTALTWLKDNLNVFEDFNDLEKLVSKSTNEIYFVPAFHGLNATYWRPDARRLVSSIGKRT